MSKAVELDGDWEFTTNKPKVRKQRKTTQSTKLSAIAILFLNEEWNPHIEVAWEKRPGW